MRVNVPQHFVIRLEYTLRVEGQAVNRSEHPLSILTGFARELPIGLEAALLGKGPGEYTVTLPPEQGYGAYNPALRVEVGASELPGTPRVGEVFSAEDAEGKPRLYQVVAVDGEKVVLDANPPWAGKALEYRFVIHSVRLAEPEEVAHGHVHGEGGVHP
ncbi:FKBP-type peptidyl-prolyl cis-trans isomerase [Meiothermus granaticius]|uniref:peptidylprolyl isomerase n=1 Tax=Meiothermus granaticius NBRC 107808 TaxID=1227551 RepID=A0A399F7M5_9DEIN|nr:peptidylprolyl isomerase [Meiothermus granaticius]RIH92238.1 FKBP-type peptidyl-prolyl cis-trans isomerase SlyD [Meiothermus granaticius NBRC 107808]GEM85586.1 peptidyl-prolyl cis-trans isomerase [Meiothermus granaticius NBRC 107808]